VLLSLRHIHHHIGKNEILRDVSIELNSGDIFTIYGPSGSGKTTLLQILGQLITPSSGTLTRDGSLTDRQRDYGYAFIDGPFFEDLTVEENILFLESFSSIEIERAYYQELIEYFEISELTGRSARTLSVGQRERTNIVRAFVHQPKIVILDEPGSNLDEALFQKTFAFLEKQARENATLLCIATHAKEYLDISTKTLSLHA